MRRLPHGRKAFSDKPCRRDTFSDKPGGRDTFSDKPRGRDTFSDKPRGREAMTRDGLPKGPRGQWAQGAPKPERLREVAVINFAFLVA